MKVIATQDGFYGSYRKQGDVFEVPEGTEGSWIEPVNEKSDIDPGTENPKKLGKTQKPSLV